MGSVPPHQPWSQLLWVELTTVVLALMAPATSAGMDYPLSLAQGARALEVTNDGAVSTGTLAHLSRGIQEARLDAVNAGAEAQVEKLRVGGTWPKRDNDTVPTSAMSQFGWYFVADVSELPQVSLFSTSIFVGNGGNVLTKTCTDVYAPCAVPLLAAADIQNLTSLGELNMTAVMSIETIFQSDVKTLLPDWRQRWETYWQLVRPHAKHILAWYPMDEPPHTWPPTGAYKNMTKQIRATAPGIPIAATVSPSIIRGLEFGAYDLPPEVDWVGFDSYNCWQWDSYLGSNASEFGCWDNRSVRLSVSLSLCLPV